MNRRAAIILTALAALAILAMAAYMFVPAPRIGGDFRMRINEVRCLDSGTDPSAVYHGEVRHPQYVAFGNPQATAAERLCQVNGYPPWTYLMIEPLSRLPIMFAWCLYFALNMVVLWLVFMAGYKWLRRRLDRTDATFALAIAMLMLVPSIGSCFQSGNYPILVLGAALAMVSCLNRRRPVLAGLCWAVAMLKPQLAIIFAIPLLLRRQFLTVLVAGATCLLAIIYPWWRCGVDPVTLIRTSVSAGANVFWGCGTVPFAFAQWFGIPTASAIGLLVGVVIAVWLTWRTDRHSDWMVYLAPSAFIATVWSYSPLYNSVMIWPLVLVLLPVMLGQRSWCRRQWPLLAIGALALMRGYSFFHGFVMLLPEQHRYSLIMHSHLEYFNQLLALVLVVGLWRWHMDNED